MTRPARVVVDLDALRHNLARVRRFAPGARVMAVVKADAYGHGIERTAAALDGADAFGVACLEEAQQVRAAAQQPVVLLEGPFTGAELECISRSGFEIVVHHHFQVEMLERVRLARPLRVWLKVDSGMHRLGFEPGEAAAVHARLQRCKSVAAPLRLMTHLANASNAEDDFTAVQIETFGRACAGLEGERSIANSAGVIAWPDSRCQWVRPGLMLYGVSPLSGTRASDHELRPVMALRSELISVKRLKRGDAVGYGGAWRCPQDMEVGVVAAGYADGYPRHAQSGTPVLVKDRRAGIVGIPSMDMLSVDLRNVSGAAVGDAVELWGPELPIEEVAEYAGTAPYELLCGVHKRLSYVEAPREICTARHAGESF